MHVPARLSGDSKERKSRFCRLGLWPSGQSTHPACKKPRAPPPQLSETRHGHIGEVEAGGSGHQGHPQLHNGFKASLGYTRQCLKKQRIQCTLPQPPPRRSPRRGGQPGQSCLLSAFPSPTPGTNLKSAPVPRPLVPSPQVTPIKDRAASCSQERWDIRGPCIEPPWSL